MNIIFKTVTNSVVKPFYREHAGLFIFLVFILFGIYRSVAEVINFHYFIIHSILTKPTYLVVAVLLWFLYAVKIIYFVHGYVNKESYVFLQNLNALTEKNRLLLLLQIQSVLFAPVLIYSLAIFFVAAKEKTYIGVSLVFIAIALLLLLLTLSFYLSLQKTKQFYINLSRFIPGLHFPKNIFNFLLRYIFREQFVALAGIKTISFCCIYFFITLNGSLAEDRILWFFLVSLMIGHVIIIYKNHRFIESQLFFYRNMPVPLIKTIFQLLAVYVVILIPELWALKGIIEVQKNATNYIIMAVTAPSLLLLIHSLLYTEDFTMEEVLKMLFGVWIVCFFLGLSGFRWLVPVSCLLLSVIIFYTCYYRYEKNTNIEGLE
ncbi:MAG: hypothetical protein JST96_14695 [Bacteroidetes bacterium]|nr:hypothetical protein [Bacteroidota bacterium]